MLHMQNKFHPKMFFTGFLFILFTMFKNILSAKTDNSQINLLKKFTFKIPELKPHAYIYNITATQ